MSVLDTNAAPAEALPKSPKQETNRRDAVWDIQEGPKNYLVLVGAQVASALFSFTAVWLATRLLGATGYGGVVAIIAASQAIAQLAVNWSSFSLSRYGVEEFVETGRIARAFWTRFWIFLPNILLVVVTSPLWLAPLASLLKLPSRAYIFVLVHFLANALWIHVQQGLQGAKLMRLQSTLLTVERLVILLWIIVLAVTGKALFLTVVLAYIVAPLGTAIAGMWSIRKLIFPILGLDRRLSRRMLAFSLPILPASFIGYMSTNHLDAFFITHYLSGADLGVYAVAYQLSGTALQLPLLAGTLLLPLLVSSEATGKDRRAMEFVNNTLPVVTLFWVIACAGIAVLGGYLIPIWFGFKFQKVADLLWPLMAASAIVGPVQMAYNPIAHAKSATSITLIASLAAAITNVLLNMLLIPHLGLIGCAWATTIAFALHVMIEIRLVDIQLLSQRSWTVQATLPIIFGAASAFYYGSGWIPFVVTVIAATLVAFFHRTSIAKSRKLLSEFRQHAVFWPRQKS